MLSVFDTCGIVLPKAIPTSPGRVSPWKIRLPQCHFDLAKFPKATTPHFLYERTFNELLATRFLGFKRIYTDGSKCGASNTISLVPSRTKTKLNATNKILIEVLDASESLFGGCDNVFIGHVLPHFERPDIVFATDDSGAAVPIPAQLKEALFASVKYAPCVKGQERWHCLVIGGWNSFIRNSTKPLGSTIAKLRQLRLVGYNPILIILVQP
uniref:Uncharacterized protein n=1 Tax=Timema shepardi TaxID=629360 RepID=A0A7R9APY5_TIMSH|nr:unnamed protein product [Timema shepardi]